MVDTLHERIYGKHAVSQGHWIAHDGLSISIKDNGGGGTPLFLDCTPLCWAMRISEIQRASRRLKINYNWECEGICFSHHKIPLSHHKTPLSHHKTPFFSEFQNKLSFGTSPTGWRMEFYQESDNFFPKNQVKKIIGQDSPRCMPLAVAFWWS